MFSTRLYSEVAASGSVTDDSCCKQVDICEDMLLHALSSHVTSHVQGIQTADATFAWRLLPVTVNAGMEVQCICASVM